MKEYQIHHEWRCGDWKSFNFCCPHLQLVGFLTYAFCCLGLGVYDALCLSLLIIKEGTTFWSHGVNESFSIPVFKPIIQPIYELVYTGSAFMTVLLTVERYLKIVHTNKSKKWCTNKRILGWILFASIFALLINIPYFMAYTWNENGEARLTDFGRSSQFFINYEVWGYFIMRFLLPWLVLVVLSTLVIIKVNFNSIT